MAVIWRRRTRGVQDDNPDEVFQRVREVETKLRVALASFREHMAELEKEIHEPSKEV